MDYRTARNIIRLWKKLLAQRNETAELEVEFRITRRSKYGGFLVQAFIPDGAYYAQWFDKWDREYRLWEFIQKTCQNYRWYYYRTKVGDND